MPLAFTQEDFLVHNNFTAHILSTTGGYVFTASVYQHGGGGERFSGPKSLPSLWSHFISEPLVRSPFHGGTPRAGYLPWPGLGHNPPPSPGLEYPHSPGLVMQRVVRLLQFPTELSCNGSTIITLKYQMFEAENSH